MFLPHPFYTEHKFAQKAQEMKEKNEEKRNFGSWTRKEQGIFFLEIYLFVNNLSRNDLTYSKWFMKFGWP